MSDSLMRQLVFKALGKSGSGSGGSGSGGSGSGGSQTRVFRALLSQAGTSAPTLDILENTLGADVDSISYEDVGYYFINFAGVVFPEKIFARLDYGVQGSAAALPLVGPAKEQNYRLGIYSSVPDTGSAVEMDMNDCPLEVIAYGDYAEFPPED